MHSFAWQTISQNSHFGTCLSKHYDPRCTSRPTHDHLSIASLGSNSCWDSSRGDKEHWRCLKSVDQSTTQIQPANNSAILKMLQIKSVRLVAKAVQGVLYQHPQGITLSPTLLWNEPKAAPPSPWCKSTSTDMWFWLLVAGYYYQPGLLLDQTSLYVHHIRCNLSSQPFDSSTMPYMHPTFNVNNQPSLAKVLCSHSVWQVSPATAKITITTHNIRGTTRVC